MNKSSSILAFIFLSPALIFLTIFLLLPLVYITYLSFTTGSFTRVGIHWIGFTNYQRLLTDPDFWQVIRNTIFFTFFTVIPTMIIPLGLAVLLNQKLPLRGILRSIYFIPSITSMVAVGLGFRWLFQTDGIINLLLNKIGLNSIPWLGDPLGAMIVLIILSTWKQIGFNLVVFLAGLQTISPNLYEAAILDGAKPIDQFRYITLPGLRPTLLLSAITTIIFTLRSFEQVYVITGGGPLNSTNLLVYYIYEQAFSQFDFGYACAIATILLVFTVILVYAQLKLSATDS